MQRYLFRRVIRLGLVWLGISLVSFFLLRMTGDPARMILGELAPAATIAEFNHQYGLDRPLFVQYVSYVGGVLSGDFGRSYRYSEPISQLILERVPATVELALASLLLSFAIGLPLGVVAALTRNSPLDYAVRGIVLVAQAIPNFYLAILAITIFSVQLHVLPTGGRDGLLSLVMPAFVLSFVLMGLMLRISRSAMLETLNRPYVTTARAKGLTERAVVARHALRNAWIPIVTVLGVQVANLLSGAIVTETVFSWPGLGRLLIAAIVARDFPLVQGAVLMIATAVVIANFLVDSVYALLDPRITVA
ncbi:MAG: ABC transporter permease [Chloroflexi bacterium]|nr:ABC transporter permease [Chloroflexota bacterium]